MLIEKSGSIFSSALIPVIPVNTQGIMGAGLAFAAKQRFKGLEIMYKSLLKCGELSEKRPAFARECLLFATKTDWQLPSKKEYIADGLDALLRFRHLEGNAKCHGGLAFPYLGCGLGGLSPQTVKPMIADFAAKAPYTVELWE